MATHSDRRYEEGLQTLKGSLLTMGAIVEEMIAGAMKAVTERDAALIAAVAARDAEVNQLEMATDDQCIALLALHQPVAADLRFITVGLKLSKDLERMGDLAVNIVEHAARLNQEPPLRPFVDLPTMGTSAQAMVKAALDAFVARDAAKAQHVCEVDDQVDRLNDRIEAELATCMQADPEVVARGIRLIAVAKNLERIADHATNIAEEVIYLVQGRDIRHGKQDGL